MNSKTRGTGLSRFDVSCGFLRTTLQTEPSIACFVVMSGHVVYRVTDMMNHTIVSYKSQSAIQKAAAAYQGCINMGRSQKNTPDLRSVACYKLRHCFFFQSSVTTRAQNQLKIFLITSAFPDGPLFTAIFRYPRGSSSNPLRSSNLSWLFRWMLSKC